MTDNNNDLNIPVGNSDHYQGDLNAPIVLVEYGDYECSYCGSAYPIIKKIQKHLGKDLCFVFRNFPLAESHPHAQHAAEAAEIAAASGKFWEYHDRLYENQDALDDGSLVGYAGGLGINEDDFSDELQSGKYENKVQEDFMGGVESGVNGTPSFFVNGSRYDGDWDYEPFMEYLSSLS
jgi:protein-disulfide isomerase